MTERQEGAEPSPVEPREATVVRMGEWKEGQGDEILETRNLGPCIGLAIYEPESRRGFLLHDPLPQDADSTYLRLEDYLRTTFQGQVGSFERMKAWLSGGSPRVVSTIAPDAKEFVQANRQFMIDALNDIGIPPESIQVSWTPDEHIRAGMFLKCATGECEIISS